MKKTPTILALMLLSMTVAAQSRIVLYEEFTSETCPPSRYTDSLLWNLLNSGSNPAHVQLVTFITPYPSQGFLFKSNQAEYTTRSNFYSIPFVSNGRIDGAVHDTFPTYKGRPDHHTQYTLDEEITEPARFNLLPSCSYNSAGDSFLINVRISCLEDFAPPGATMKLYAAFVRTLDYTAPPGTNGQTHFENMARRMYPSASGTVIDSVWAAGDIYDLHLSGAVPSETADSALHPHASSPGILVVWLQNDNDKIVEQCARTVPLPATTTETQIATRGSVILYPNPVSDHLNINLDASCPPPYALLITDMAGRVMYQHIEDRPGTAKINTAHWAPGIYTLLVQSGTTRHETIFQKRGAD
ncbi:MAG: T9SS type A sorting domain-containing protein [Taibaiella sp.]|nr:T9SS type A sorting domain-containing protein [Taibaiella sp.]